MKISKSRFTSEKSGVLAIAMALLSLGMAVFTSCSQHISCTWQFAVEVIFGIILIAVGILVLKLREYLKLNRWGHSEVVCDNTIMQRFITWWEGE